LLPQDVAMTIAVGLLIGLILGLTGAGGSIFAVPMFILLLGLSVNDAIGVSLGAVSITAVVGVMLRCKQRDIAWKPGLIIAMAGIVTAPMGRWIGANTNDNILLTGFALLAIVLALKMWKQAADNQKLGVKEQAGSGALQTDDQSLENYYIENSIYLIGSGLVCGFLSGLFGVGGGFIIVPLLTLYAGMGIKQAVGTSLLVISLVSAMGFGFHLLNVAQVPADILLRTSIGSVLGIVLGTIIAKELAGPKLQKLFACSVIGLMAVTIYRTIL
jgi:uncharacterized membrane protein YfcA